MKGLLTGLLSLTCATSALAQDLRWGLDAPGELPTSLSTAPQPGGAKDWAVSLLVEVLLPPEGDATSGIEWKDAFSEGVGLRVEFDRLWGIGAGDTRLGVYGGIGATMFGGEEVLGGTVELDPLITAILVVGAKLAYRPPDGLQVEARAGFGMVSYFETDGDFGGISTEVIDSSQEFFYEVGGRLGFVAGSIVLQIGLQVRSQAEPDPADPSSLDFEDAMLIYGLDAGILIKF